MKHSIFNYLAFLQVLLFLFISIVLLKGRWIGDFWEHAAIVKQFAHSYTDSHPLLNIDKPHAFYSPYLFGLGFIAKFTGLSVVRLLTITAIANCFLLIYIFTKFIATLYNNNKVAFYSLLFTIFFWWKPYFYSGFISINVINFVLPYPSTFALILTFLVFIIFHPRKTFTTNTYILSTIINSTILITHPLTGIISTLALFAIHLNKFGFRVTKNWILLGVSILITFSLVFLWPYYSFFELIQGASDVYHSSNKIMYDNVLSNTFPAILALPIIIIQGLKKKSNKTLIYLFFALVAIYLFGFISGKWSYGRTLSFIVIICHVYLAGFIVRLTKKYKRRPMYLSPLYIFILIATVFFVVRNTRINDLYPKNQWMISEKMYQGLSQHLFEKDVVFSTKEESWQIPAFGPKIVSTFNPQSFIDDSKQRIQDTNMFFFNTAIDDSTRKLIIRKYGVNKILLNRRFVANESLEKWLSANASIIFRDNRFVLYKTNK